LGDTLGEATLEPTVARTDDLPTTTRSARWLAMAAYVLALAAYSKVVGLPSDTVQVFAWMWAATVAWNIQAPRRDHLVFVRDWWPALAVLEIYLYSRGLTDNIGLTVHVTEPITADNWLGGGELPTQHLQAWMCGEPCKRSNPPHWYDGALTMVYYTHFIAAPITALVLWMRNRTVWLSFMRRYVSLYMAGLLVYITYPMAPPWMASRDGYVEGATVTRITGRGWEELDLSHFHQWLSRMGNQVAAMPSLHAGTAALIAFYGVVRLRSRWRFLLLAYPLAMSFMLVYYGEHYVVDILAGWLLAILVMAACTSWERQGAAQQWAVATSSALLGGTSSPGIPLQRDSGRASPPGRTVTVDTVADGSRSWRERTRPWLGRLRTAPPLVLPSTALVLVLIAVSASPWVAIPTVLLLAAFVAWVGALSWERAGDAARVLRVVAVVVVLSLPFLRLI
jgi:hypothetical protein